MSKSSEEQPRHPIGVVCRRTGLKPDLIRAWERRYGAIVPSRSATRRRMYTDADIERLKLLRQAVAGGRGIRHVAHLTEEELGDLIADDRAAAAEVASSAEAPTRETSSSVPKLPPGEAKEIAIGLMSSCLEAVQKLDSVELELQLERASVSLSRVDLLDRLLVPLMHRIGDLWKDGVLRPSHEHLASAVVRSFLGKLSSQPASVGAPHLLVTTPAGQYHELGALMVAECALEEGWQITYLGPNLPAEEIAAGSHQRSVRAIALSVTYPPDDPHLGSELGRLRRLVAPEVEILVGGRSAQAYTSFLDKISARHITSLATLRQVLETLRHG